MFYPFPKTENNCICVQIPGRIIRVSRVVRLLLIFIFSCSITSLELFFMSQNSFSSDGQTPLPCSDQNNSETVVNTANDSIVYKSNLKLNQKYHFHPVHPYFRDRYRIIQDLRRLVQMFNHNAVHGYESMSDLADICRKLPEHKQTEMIFTALAGGVVNFVSEETSKQLRKKKINFLQWKLEKIVFSNRLKYFYINIHTGMNTKGIGLYIPALRIQYYRYSSPYYSSESITFWPMRKIGFNCARWNGHVIIAPYVTTSIGTVSLSYDYDHQIVCSRLDIRQSSSLIVRILYINYLERVNSDRLLGEVLIYW